MARKGKRTFKRRLRGDWVYRGEEYDEEGGLLASQVASYVGVNRNVGTYVLQPGTDVGIVLYDSYNYLASVGGRIGGFNYLGHEARAEGRAATVMAVQGVYFLQPNTWTVGSDWCVAARIVICDQNMNTGALDLPANYFLPIAPTNPVSMWANGWGNLRERIDRQAFSTENDMARWKFGLNWRGKRRLQAHECLGIFFQSGGPAVGSTTLTVSPLFRSLVHDPNA